MKADTLRSFVIGRDKKERDIMKTEVNHYFPGLALMEVRKVVEWKHLLNKAITLDWK